MFKKGIDVIVPLFNVTLCLLMLHSLRLPIFPSVYCYELGGRRRLTFFILLPHPLSLSNCFCPYSGKTSYHSGLHFASTPLVSSPPPVASALGSVLSDDLPIALRKGKCQCAHPISSFCSYDHLSSHYCSFIASLDSISLPNKVSEAHAQPS